MNLTYISGITIAAVIPLLLCGLALHYLNRATRVPQGWALKAFFIFNLFFGTIGSVIVIATVIFNGMPTLLPYVCLLILLLSASGLLGFRVLKKALSSSKPV